MNILININNLRGTGAPRVLFDLATQFVSDGHTVVFLSDEDEAPTFEVPGGTRIFTKRLFRIKEVELVDERRSAAQRKVARFVASLVRHIKPVWNPLLGYFFLRNQILKLQPDVALNNDILSDLGFQSVLASICPSIICVHMDPIALYDRFTDISGSSIADFFDGQDVVCVSRVAADNLRLKFPRVKSCQPIYNIVCRDRISEQARESVTFEVPGSYVVVVGSLIERKRIDRVIRALPHVNRDCHLVVMGSGALESALRELSGELGVSDRVQFLGFLKSPYSVISGSLGLALSSDAEGLPTVLIEALALGVPVVATDCVSGPSEILSGDANRFLVSLDQSESEIVGQIASHLNAFFHRESAIDFERIIHQFEPEVVANQWYELFQRLEVGTGLKSS